METNNVGTKTVRKIEDKAGDEVIAHTLYKTQEYDKFSFLAGNRQLQEAHIQRLIKSLAFKNILEFYPILVNSEYCILDGQHRFAAARRMNIPFYYHIIDEDLSMRIVQILNANTRTWKFEDYLASYIQQGKADYIELAEFAKQYNVTDSVAFHLLNASRSIHHSHSSYEKFYQGTWNIADRKLAHQIAEALQAIEPYTALTVASNRAFINALRIVIIHGSISHVLSRFQQKPDTFRIMRQDSTADYLRIMGLDVEALRETDVLKESDATSQ